MKKYLALFVAPLEAFDKMNEEIKTRSKEDMNVEMEAWKTWMENHKAEIVNHGGGVGKAKRITEDGEITDTRNTIGGYMIIQAENAESAAGIFKTVHTLES